MTEDEFDLFGELTKEDQQELAKRKETINTANETRIKELNHILPKDRSMRTNSWVFSQVRKRQFNQPFIKPSILNLQECHHILHDIVPQLETSWTTQRHGAFPTIDIPLSTTPCLQYLIPIFYDRLIEPILAPYFGFGPSQLGFRDVFLVLYDAEKDKNHVYGQTGLAPHKDGSLISFNILINSPDDYEGGGTFFYTESSESSESSLSMSVSPNEKGILINPSQQGDCVIHCGKILHEGVNITKGKRMIIVGFIDTFDTIKNDKLSTNLRNI